MIAAEQHEKTALRDAYGDALIKLGEKYENIVVLDADLSSSTKTVKFHRAFPDRFFNMGIAEQNLMGVAAGISTCNLVPFVSSFAIFAAGRAFEQVRNSVSYPNLNVKIAATHAGLSAGKDGGSHEAIEDIALMRSIPNMTVLSPCDALEVYGALEAAYQHHGPVYIRLSRMELPLLHSKVDFQIGKGEVLKDGKDAAIIATGTMVSRALDAAKQLELRGIDAAVLNIASIKPIDRELILEYARKTGKLVTAEEHSIYGGLSSAVSEIVTDEYPVKVAKIAIMDRFGQSGKPDELFKEYQLTVENITQKVKLLL